MSRLSRSRRPWFALALGAACLWAALPVHGGQAEGPPEEFTAFAIAMGRISSGATATFVFNISRWTSDTERDRLFGALREKGQRAMIDAFRDTTRVGTMRTPHTVGYDLQFAYQEPAPEGRRRIILATDRPIDFAEAWARPPSMDYPFTIVEMVMNPDGRGQGAMHIAARLVPAGKTLVVESYDTQPVQLNNIQSRTLSR
jgi:hypothetical protein